MKTSTLLCGGLLCAAAALLLWTRAAGNGMEKQNALLRATLSNRTSGGVQAQSDSLTDPSGTAIPEWSRSELIRLRKEVRELRDQRANNEKLEAENVLLARAISEFKPAPRLAEQPGYASRASWVHAGFLTPESTLQSFFRAVRDGDEGQAMFCLGQTMSKQTPPSGDPEKDKQRFISDMQPFPSMSGYRIAEQQVKDENTVILSVQAAAGGAQVDMVMQRTGNEWKIAAIK